MTDTTRTSTFAPSLRHGAALLLLALAGCSYEHSVDPSPSELRALPSELRALDEGPVLHYVGSLASASVAVLDSNGVGVRGVEVTFDVMSGGGSISLHTVVTGADGIATARSWTLGMSPGLNTLVASVPGLTPVAFERTAIRQQVGVCTSEGTHLFGSTTVARLDSSDCLSDGVYIDTFGLTLDEPDAYLFTESSAAFPIWLTLYSAGRRIAESYDTSKVTTSTPIKALLPAGRYALLASSWTWFTTGAYTLSSSRTTSEASGCEEVFVVFGLSTAQHIEPTDCARPGGRGRADRFTIYLAPGESMTVTMASPTVDPYLEVVYVDPFTFQLVSVATNDNAASGTTSAKLVITGARDTYYIIYAGTAADGQAGEYRLDVTK